LSDLFSSIFGKVPDVTAEAHGRVNLIGDHTDYNGGFVLPTVIPQGTQVHLARRPDRKVHCASLEFDSGRIREFEIGNEQTDSTWLDYVQGVTWALRNRGAVLSGFDATISSSVPVGKGLSSSAALEISMLRALVAAYELPLDSREIAAVAHRAETGFVGAPVGIMDQTVCSLGRDSSALFLDALTGDYQHVPIPASIELAVIDSGIAHHHVIGGYQQRRRECELAAAQLGVVLLRDVSMGDLPRLAVLPDTLRRRATHVVT